MLAFSTSSSAATLPLTMKRVEKNLNVSDEVTSFVCPLGATINMDGTSIHQAISAVFIAQAFGQDPQFFAFYRAMQAYEKALIGGETSLILSPDSEFFKFFGNIKSKSAQ